MAARTRMERDKAKQAQDTAQALRDRAQPVLDAISPLSKRQQENALFALRELTKRLLEEEKREKEIKNAMKRDDAQAQKRRNKRHGIEL